MQERCALILNVHLPKLRQSLRRVSEAAACSGVASMQHVRLLPVTPETCVSKTVAAKPQARHFALSTLPNNPATIGTTPRRLREEVVRDKISTVGPD